METCITLSNININPMITTTTTSSLTGPPSPPPSYLSSYRTSKVLGSDLVYLEEYMKLLDRQLKVQELDQNVISESKKLPFQPLYTTLLYLCQWHGQEKEVWPTTPSPTHVLY